MFSYYGSKSKVVHLYPSPKYHKIIEPFAGSARYSLRYFYNDVLLVDKYQVIVDVWHYLQQASEADILGLPKLKRSEKIPETLSLVERQFMGFLVSGGSPSPKKTVTPYRNENTGLSVSEQLRTISKQLYKIRNWTIVCDTYKNIDNQEATWFIDPPYQFGGNGYVESNKGWDYSKLADWCKSRNGQIIVCENTKADWMPFYPMKDMYGSMYTTTEAIWCNQPHNFEARQTEMF